MMLLTLVLICGCKVFCSSDPVLFNKSPSKSELRTKASLSHCGASVLSRSGTEKFLTNIEECISEEMQSESAPAKTWFAGKSLSEIKSALARMRPEPVNQSDRALLMKELPLANADKRVQDKREVNILYQRLQKTLEFFERDAIVELIIVRHPQPIVYSKPGVVMAISTEVLKIVGSDDAALVGIVAHELAHEYLALQFYEALQSGNLSRMRELELFCDAVAVVVVLDLGFDPRRYARALKRIANHSRESVELNNGASSHPAVRTRLQLIDDVSSLFVSSAVSR